MTDSEFKKKFEDCTFDPSKFTHEAHLHLAWIHINQCGPEEAAENLCRQIERFDKKFGDGTKYNKTVTIAAVRILYSYMQKSKSHSFEHFIHTYPELKETFKKLISLHYSFDIFSSAEAKYEYIPPDLRPF